MLHFPLWKKITIGVVVLIGFLTTAPNFFYRTALEASEARSKISKIETEGGEADVALLEKAGRWPSYLPAGVVNLGLDLQGGAHFLLELKAEQVLADRLESIRRTVPRELREAGVDRYVVKISGANVLVEIGDTSQIERAARPLNAIARNATNDGLPLTVELTGDNRTYRFAYSEQATAEMASRAVDSAIEVLRVRVDELGTREPTIIKQGADRILLQLPGVQQVDLAEILKPSKLTFHMVVEPGVDPEGRGAPTEVPYNSDLNPDVPEGATLQVYEIPDIEGADLVEARQGRHSETREIGVNIRFNAKGAEIFRELSTKYRGRRFAMVLDGEILSAPVFESRIIDGAAIITGSFTAQSARSLAVNLNSGSLPAELTEEESSFVGPELGADSIAAGRIAIIVGFIAVLVYMALSYGLFGLLANVALMVNVILIFGALSSLGATLTLPGIAGIVLTIGMAVDANVLVFERIREELANGRKPASAIETGYSRAFTAIIDANVTTFIAAAILFSLGSGPVRGFSVTLAIGILTSVFTAVMLTRFLVSTWLAWRRPKTLEL